MSKGSTPYALRASLLGQAQSVLEITLGSGGACGLTGDVNGDLAVNVVDVVLMVNYILSQEYDNCADISGDSALNVVDVVLLVNSILGL